MLELGNGRNRSVETVLVGARNDGLLRGPENSFSLCEVHSNDGV